MGGGGSKVPKLGVGFCHPPHIVMVMKFIVFWQRERERERERDIYIYIYIYPYIGVSFG